MIQQRKCEDMYTYKKNTTNFNYKIGKLVVIFLIFLGFIIQTSSTQAASIKIRYGGKTFLYTQAQAGATLDGTKINLKKTPGILIDDTCMLPLNTVFKASLKANYKYDSKTKKLVITQNDITIEMKLNSKTAKVNGKSVTVDAAPRQIKLYEANVTNIYVPARFVAESLGYTYTWNSTTKASDMLSPMVIKYAKDWTVYTGIQGKVTFDGKNINLNGMPSIIIDNTALMRVSSVFQSKLGADYKYDKATKKLTVAKNNITIEMEVDSKTALVNGVSYTMGTSPRVVYNKSTGKSYVMVPGEFVATKLGYEYTWDKVSNTSKIQTGETVFFEQVLPASPQNQTSISSVKAYTSNKNEILELNGTDMLDVFINDIDESQIQLIVSNAYTEIDTISQVINDSKYLKAVSAKIVDGTIIFTIEKAAACNYYTSETGNTYKLVFGDNVNIEDDNEFDDSEVQMKINIPKEVDFDSIETEDLYLKNMFTVTLSGDHTTYLGQNPIEFDSSIVRDVSYKTDSSGNTIITVYTNKLQGYKLSDGGSYIGIKIGNPKDIFDKIVVLDPGHGGDDSGTSNKKVYEKNLNLTILYDLAKEYFNSKDSTIKAYWTRTNDTKPSLQERAAFAKKVGADVFISLHMNSATATASGTEVLYASNNKATMQGMSSKQMAALFQDYLVETLELSGRKIVDRTKLVVLYSNTVPSILIELGFLSNSKDFAKITDPAFQELTAQAIYDATVSMFEMYPTGR